MLNPYYINLNPIKPGLMNIKQKEELYIRFDLDVNLTLYKESLYRGLIFSVSDWDYQKIIGLENMLKLKNRSREELLSMSLTRFFNSYGIVLKWLIDHRDDYNILEKNTELGFYLPTFLVKKLNFINICKEQGALAHDFEDLTVVHYYLQDYAIYDSNRLVANQDDQSVDVTKLIDELIMVSSLGQVLIPNNMTLIDNLTILRKKDISKKYKALVFSDIKLSFRGYFIKLSYGSDFDEAIFLIACGFINYVDKEFDWSRFIYTDLRFEEQHLLIYTIKYLIQEFCGSKRGPEGEHKSPGACTPVCEHPDSLARR